MPDTDSGAWIRRAASWFCALVMVGVAQGEVPSPGPKAPLGVLRIVQSRYPVAIPKLDHIFDVGNRATLVQENETWFVISSETKDGLTKLAAVPRRKGNIKVAWVSPEDTVFFGYRVACVDGFLYLPVGEELPVLSESDDAYEVLIKKAQRSVTLLLPKGDPALYFIPNPVYGQVVETPQATETFSRPGPAALPSRDRKPELPARSKGVRAPAVPQMLIPPLDTNWDLFVVSYLLPDEWAIATSVVVEGRKIQRVRSERPYMQRLTLSSIAVVARWIVIGVLSFILVVVVGVAALGKVRLTKKVPGLPQINPAEPAREESVPIINTPPVPDFSGTLSSMSLGAVMQFLNSDKETGTLTVLSEEHQPIGTIDFLTGEIVNARTDAEEGIPAVHRLLANAEGHFAFMRSKNPNFQRKITEPTMSLLLEAHQMLDEVGEAAREPAKAKQSPKKDSLRLRRRAGH